MINRPLLYIFGGLGVGAVAALLLAPKSGRETRAAIKSSVAKGEKFIKRQSNEISGAITDTWERGRKAARRTTRACDRLARRTATLPKALADAVR